MSDNSYSTTFGPSTPGALNVVSGEHLSGDLRQQEQSEDCAQRQWIWNDCRGPRSQRRQLLGRNHDPDGRPEYRRPFECQWDQLGILHGRLQSQSHQSGRIYRMLPDQPGHARQRRTDQGLNPASSLVPVLGEHREPDAQAPQRTAPGSTVPAPTRRRITSTTSTTSSMRSMPAICPRSVS